MSLLQFMSLISRRRAEIVPSLSSSWVFRAASPLALSALLGSELRSESAILRISHMKIRRETYK